MNQHDSDNPKRAAGEHLPDLDLSEENREARVPQVRSLAPLIPKILIALGVVALLFVIIKYFFLGEEAAEAPVPASSFTSSIDGMPATTGELDKPASSSGTPEGAVEVGEALPGASLPIKMNEINLQNRVLVLEKKLEELSEVKRSLEALKEEHQKILSTGGTPNGAVIKTMSTELENLKNTVENQTARLQQLESYQNTAGQTLTRVAALENAIQEMRLMREKEAAIEQKGLPFRILSVDLWNGKPYVAVALGEKVSLITVGDVIMGWKVQSIDFDGEKAIFVKNGKRVEQSSTR